MKNFWAILFFGVLLLSNSVILVGCKKIPTTTFDIIGGEWKCDGLVTKWHNGSNWTYTLQPYSDAVLTIKERKVIFQFKSEKRTYHVTNINSENNSSGDLMIEMTLRSSGGQKIEEFFRFDGNYLYGQFYSPDGFVKTADWGYFVDLEGGPSSYVHHQFSKIE